MKKLKNKDHSIIVQKLLSQTIIINCSNCSNYFEAALINDLGKHIPKKHQYCRACRTFFDYIKKND